MTIKNSKNSSYDFMKPKQNVTPNIAVNTFFHEKVKLDNNENITGPLDNIIFDRPFTEKLMEQRIYPPT